MMGRRNSRSGPNTNSSASQIVDLPTLLPPTKRVWPWKSTMPCATLRKFVMVNRLTRTELPPASSFPLIKCRRIKCDAEQAPDNYNL